MTDQTIQRDRVRRPMRSPARNETPAANEVSRSTENNPGYLASLDKPLLLIVSFLLVIGAGMVFSTTFNWSLEARGSSTAIFLEDHMRNVTLSVIALVIFSVVDYRFWKRFTPLLLLVTLGALIAVLIFGDTVFNARRALIGGRLQPGELAEFTVVMYMAAWLGSKRTQVNSLFFGLIPFGVLLSIVIIPIAMQPDISTVVIIVMTASAMYFLAGARIWHLALVAVLAGLLGTASIQVFPHAQTRIDAYTEFLENPANCGDECYHTQQVIVAFVNGGWLGKGLGEGTQKFNNALPAPHTDSIFAVIGEELGVVGASVVVLLFVAFVIRGFNIAQRAVDPFGALLATGFTLWVAVQALLNIAVMTAVIPTSGLPLPFISYGGSALMVTMIGVGLILSVGRVATIRENASKRRQHGPTYDRRWGNRRTRLSRTGSRRSSSQNRHIV
jgi:cell division protein FtsW